MTTELLEFKNKKGNILRGVLVSPDNVENNHVVIMLGGFERAATTERKFKALADALVRRGVSSFRFDVTDVGLSDGNFYDTTTQTMSDDLSAAINVIGGLGFKRVSFVGHSHAASTLSLILKDVDFSKIVLLAPGTNQQGLWQMWFVKVKNPGIDINFSNYKNYFNEEEYRKTLDDISWTDSMTASHALSPELRKVNSFIDYADNYKDCPPGKILIIHGTNDSLCPAETVNINTPNKIMVKGGDHDMEKPEQLNQWLTSAVDFLTH